MTNLRQAAQQALEALEAGDMAWAVMNVEGVKQNLRAALAQEQAEPICKCDLRTRLVGDGCEVCNPELAAELAQEQAESPCACWPGRLCSRQAQCAADVRKQQAEPVQEQAEPDAYGYASYLAVAIWEKHYKDTAPNWKPLDYLTGVLTQIDNMTAGLTRQQAEPVQEPAYKIKIAGRWHEAEPFAAAFSLPDGEHLLYTAPPKLVPLTEKEIMDAFHAARNAKLGASQDNSKHRLSVVEIARAVERAHGISP